MAYEHRVSLIAEVGNYEMMDKSLADKLKALPENSSFQEAVKVINGWAIEDVRNRKMAEYSARSRKLTI